jgi:hypothetical protein
MTTEEMMMPIPRAKKTLSSVGDVASFFENLPIETCYFPLNQVIMFQGT